VILQPSERWLGEVMLTLVVSLAAKPDGITEH
jgi:hypothetical protein